MAALATRLACAAPPELLSPAFGGQWPWVPVVLVGWAGSTFAEELAFRLLLHR